MEEQRHISSQPFVFSPMDSCLSIVRLCHCGKSAKMSVAPCCQFQQFGIRNVDRLCRTDNVAQNELYLSHQTEFEVDDADERQILVNALQQDHSENETWVLCIFEALFHSLDLAEIINKRKFRQHGGDIIGESHLIKIVRRTS